MDANTRPRRLKTLARCFEVIDALQQLDGARVTELAEHMELSPSTVHGYLSTLEEHRYVIKTGDEYRIGLKFLHVGGGALVDREGYKTGRRKVEQLASDTGERAQFIVEEHGIGIYLHTASEETSVQIDSRIGKETHLHSSAAGKSILAHLPERRVDEVVERWGLPELTPNTITNRDTLDEELEEIRDQNYAFNDNESTVGLRAVGAPVIGPNDRVIGALSVSGPSNRMDGTWYTEELPTLLLGAANEIELKITYQ